MVEKMGKKGNEKEIVRIRVDKGVGEKVEERIDKRIKESIEERW